MKKRISPLSWVMVISLITILLAASMPSISQTRSQQPATKAAKLRKAKPRAKLTVAQRFARKAASSPRENALLPAVLHAVERYLQGTPAETEIDKAIRGAKARHPRVTREILQELVDNWKSIPASTKAKFTPPELRNLKVTDKPDIKTLGTVLRRSGRGKPPATAPSVLKSKYAPKAVAKVSAIINSFTPNAPYPGEKVTIKGVFPNKGKGAWSLFLNSEQLSYAKVAPIQMASNYKEATLTLPKDILPGAYQAFIWFSAAGSGSPFGKIEQLAETTMTVRGHQYEVRFTKMKCIDKPGEDECESDDIVTFWSIRADGFGIDKTSQEYEDKFSNGAETFYVQSDQLVFPFSTGAAPPNNMKQDVQQYLYVGANLFEWDGDFSMVVQILGFIGDAAKTITGLLGEEYKFLGEIAKVILDLAGKIVGLFTDDPDNLGIQEKLWRADELQVKTANPKKNFSGELFFNNAEAAGNYQVSYTVSRK